jgi:hypothetical protein
VNLDYKALMVIWDERDRRLSLRRNQLTPGMIWALVSWRRTEAEGLSSLADQANANRRITADWEMKS